MRHTTAFWCNRKTAFRLQRSWFASVRCVIFRRQAIAFIEISSEEAEFHVHSTNPQKELILHQPTVTAPLVYHGQNRKNTFAPTENQTWNCD